jgi:hypothetical protein
VPTNDVLTPREASHIATNAYFALENWINSKPVAGIESRANLHNRVLGAGNKGTNQPMYGAANPTLRNTDLSSSRLGSIHTAKTGINTSSGFGYTLTYRSQGLTHVIIALRGTRPELARGPDILTDLRAGMDGFGPGGFVHIGFKRTFESLLPSLERDSALVRKADVVHCVGHSLGGAIATLVAAHYASAGKPTRLYTFGSPRVGALGGNTSIERLVGKQNIFRVAHDLDPITLIGPYPYIHVNGGAKDQNNMTLPSPIGNLIGTANHDMNRYILSVGEFGWDTVRRTASRVDHNNSVLARWLLHNDSDAGWVRYASAQTLTMLFKLFSIVLKTISTVLVLGLTAVDLLAEILVRGLHLAKGLGEQILVLLRHAAKWAGITVSSASQFTADIIRRILDKMLTTLRQLAVISLASPISDLAPVPLIIGAQWMLSAYQSL